MITQLQPITVIFPIPEDNLPQIQEQLHVGTTLEVMAYDRANVTKLATGRVVALDSQIDTSTGTLKVRAEFDNADEKLFPNQFVNARLLVRILHDVVTMPIAAVQGVAPSTYVYLINADDTVSVRPIKLGPTDGETTQVESGLAAGDRVVVDGSRPAARWRARHHAGAKGTSATDAGRINRRSRTTRSEPRCVAALAPQSRAAAESPLRSVRRKACSGQRRSSAMNAVRDLHPASGRDLSADGGDHAGGNRRLSVPAALGVAGGRLSDHPGADLLPRREPRGDDFVGDRAAGAAVRPDARASIR